MNKSHLGPDFSEQSNVVSVILIRFVSVKKCRAQCRNLTLGVRVVTWEALGCHGGHVVVIIILNTHHFHK